MAVRFKKYTFATRLSRCCDRVCRRASEVVIPASEILATEINLITRPYLSSHRRMKHLQASYNKSQQDCTVSQLYFGKELYMFRIYLLSIIRSSNTVYTALGIFHASCVDCLLDEMHYFSNLF